MTAELVLNDFLVGETIASFTYTDRDQCRVTFDDGQYLDVRKSEHGLGFSMITDPLDRP